MNRNKVVIFYYFQYFFKLINYIYVDNNYDMKNYLQYKFFIVLNICYGFKDMVFYRIIDCLKILYFVINKFNLLRIILNFIWWLLDYNVLILKMFIFYN